MPLSRNLFIRSQSALSMPVPVVILFVIAMLAVTSLSPSFETASFVHSFSTTRQSHRRSESTTLNFAFPWFGGSNEKDDETDENLGKVASVMDSMNKYSATQTIAKRTQGVLQDLSNTLIEGSSVDGKVKITYNAQQKPIGVQVDAEYIQSLKDGEDGAEELSVAIQHAMEEAHERSNNKVQEKMSSLYKDSSNYSGEA